MYKRKRERYLQRRKSIYIVGGISLFIMLLFIGGSVSGVMLLYHSDNNLKALPYENCDINKEYLDVGPIHGGGWECYHLEVMDSSKSTALLSNGHVHWVFICNSDPTHSEHNVYDSASYNYKYQGLRTCSPNPYSVNSQSYQEISFHTTYSASGWFITSFKGSFTITIAANPSYSMVTGSYTFSTGHRLSNKLPMSFPITVPIDE